MRTQIIAIGVWVLAAFAIGGIAPAMAAEPEICDAAMEECIKGCATDDEKIGFCTRYCKCLATEITKAGRLAQIWALMSQSAADQYPLTCAGREGPSGLKTTCLARCPKGQKCAESCACLESKVKAIGTELEIGKFLMQVGLNDPGAKARITGFRTECKVVAK